MHGFIKKKSTEELLKNPMKIKDYMKNMDFVTFKAVVFKVRLKHCQRVHDFHVFFKKLSGPNKQPISLYTFKIMGMIFKKILC